MSQNDHNSKKKKIQTQEMGIFFRIGGPYSEQVGINSILEKPGFRVRIQNYFDA